MTPGGWSRSNASLFAVVTLGACLLALFQCTCRAGGGARPGSPAPISASRARRLYAQTISLPADATPGLKHVADDVASLLGRATGVPFTVELGGRRGISFVRVESPDAPPELVNKLQGRSREAYATLSRGDGRMCIAAHADEGLTFGAYQWLERLGFHFFLPNDHFTIVPSLVDIERQEDVVAEPAFRVRQFTGTGGFGKALVVDPQARLAARWETWKRRNGFGEQFHINGHSGEDFNVRNRETLLAHPEFLAKVGGSRAAWSKIAKLDPSNRSAVDLFVRDRMAAYRAQKQRDPSGPGSFAVSVEPADGGGHCDSDDCAKIGSVSDQQFFLANEVARALRKEFPDARASLFAYNLHADVPKIPIEPNVYVTIVPYAFQRTGEDPEQFIREWVKKKSPLSIYDYWSIPDWVADQPSFDFLNTPARKLRFWRSQQIEGAQLESTFSAGAMGLAWYISGHLMWDPARDPKGYEDIFLRESFANSEPAMRRMLERWASGFFLSSLELHDSFSDLSEAFARSPSPDVAQRIGDFAGYVQYLRLRQEWLLAAPAEALEKKRALVLHLWRMYDSAMLDTFRLQQLVLRKDTVLGPELDPTRADLPLWRELRPPTVAEERQWVDAGLQAYPELGVHRKVFGGALRPASRSAPEPPETAAPSVSLTLVGSNQLELAVPPTTTPVQILLSITEPLQVRLFDDAGNVQRSQQFGESDSAQAFEIAAPQGGTYRLDLRTAKLAHVTLNIPSQLGATLTEFRIPKGVPIPDLYFFVPATESAVAVYDPIALGDAGVSILDADGQAAPFVRRDGGRLIIAQAAPDQRGRVWRLRHALAPDGPLRLLNAPQRLSLTPSGLTVPEGALSSGVASSATAGKK